LGAESDQIPSYDDVDDINGENSPSFPSEKKTSEYDYDDAGLFYENNDESATGAERNDVLHLSDEQNVSISENQDEIHLSVDPDYDDSMSA
ncbi:hypothetical protein GDO78_020576, partial [Eleutherodactylus coqui]